MLVLFVAAESSASSCPPSGWVPHPPGTDWIRPAKRHMELTRGLPVLVVVYILCPFPLPGAGLSAQLKVIHAYGQHNE